MSERNEKETREYHLFCEKCGPKRTVLNDGSTAFWCPRHPKIELMLVPRYRP